MALVEWSDEFSVNIGDIDAQHQQLLGIVNRLHDAMRIGEGKTALEKTFAELVAYTKMHFAFEEELMARHGYELAAEHKKLHEKLTAQVIDMQRRYEDGGAVMSVEVLHFLKHWISGHIRENDRQYSSHLRSKGVL